MRQTEEETDYVSRKGYEDCGLERSAGNQILHDSKGYGFQTSVLSPLVKICYYTLALKVFGQLPQECMDV